MAKNGKSNGDSEPKTKFKRHEFNRCRPIVGGEPSRRYFWMDELAKGGDPKEAHARAAKRWSKASGETEERYGELIPSTPSNVAFFLKTMKAQNKKAGVLISAKYEDGVVTVKQKSA